jgi:hypothetical protein
MSILSPQLDEVVNSIKNNFGYPVWLVEQQDDNVAERFIETITLLPNFNTIELKILLTPKIDEIREIIQSLHITSMYASIRVIIITNMQAMNIYSCNALLKTLEEPKKNCFFVLFTTNIAQLLPTIISRSRVIKLAGSELLQDKICAVNADLDVLWSSNLVNELEIAEKWCKLYEAKVLTLLWHCLHQRISNQLIDASSLKNTSNIVPNNTLWAMFSKVQTALQIISKGLSPNLQLMLEDLLIAQ